MVLRDFGLMARLLTILIVAAVVLGGGLYALAARNGERAQARVEKVVTLESLQK